MDLLAYRQSTSEKARAADLLRLIPPRAVSVLDVGARDGYLSTLLADRVPRVVALDIMGPASGSLELPWVQGDVARLPFNDASFDVVVCAEVLEHLAARVLASSSNEIKRVARRTIVIGVPFQQDLRVGRTTCQTCRRHNPPYGHVNRFTLKSLARLFHPLVPTDVSYVGMNRETTNPLSRVLMDLAGNPWGTYEQAEPCIHCGAALSPPGRASVLQRSLSRIAVTLNDLQARFYDATPTWVHVVFDGSASKRTSRP